MLTNWELGKEEEGRRRRGGSGAVLECSDIGSDQMLLSFIIDPFSSYSSNANVAHTTSH